MRVKIYYTVPKMIVREVDDYFKVLTEDGGWGTLSYEDRETISEELCEAIEQFLDDESVLHCVETLDDEILIDL